MHKYVFYLVLLQLIFINCHSSIGQQEDRVINEHSVDVKDFTYIQILEQQNKGLRIWNWETMDLPPLPWPDETKFGKDFYVDAAYDQQSVSLVDDRLRFYINPVDPTPEEKNKYHYRAEIHTAPWHIEHDLKTEQWLGWEYTFGDNYIIDTTSPVTIFQNHPGVRGLSPQIELEIAALDTPRPATGGEIQIINAANNDRIVTAVKPVAGEKLRVVIHIIYGLEREGLLQVWLNDVLEYNKEASTVYEDYPWGGNNKWGIYHHTFKKSPSDVQATLNSGVESMELFMGPLRTWTRTPDQLGYKSDAYDIVRPEN